MRTHSLVLHFAALATFAGMAHAQPATPASTVPALAPGNPIVGVDTGVVLPEPNAEVIGANGERIPVNIPAPASPESVTATPTVLLTPAERAALQRQRIKAARSDQILHSIAPRTGNDRTDQMPDDPLPPTLPFAR